MAKKPEDVGAEFLLDLIKTVDDSERAARVVERLLVLNPQDAGEWRSLGLLFAGLGQRRRAIGALEQFVALSPPTEDATAARKLMNQLAGQIARLN